MAKHAGKTALITGAASGIGLATAQLLAAQGILQLVLVDRDAEALERVTLRARVTRIVGDVADPALWAAADIGQLDFAVLSAGVAAAAPIDALDFAEWRRVMAINLDGMFLSLQAAMRAMAETGAIVAVASAAGVKAEPGIAAYATSKAGVIQLAKVAAKEGASRGIRVNAIAPAGVETPIWDAVPMFAERAAEIGRDAAFAEMARAATPLGRFAKPEEIAAQIDFLLSEEAAFITGATLLSDGGYTL